MGGQGGGPSSLVLLQGHEQGVPEALHVGGDDVGQGAPVLRVLGAVPLVPPCWGQDAPAGDRCPLLAIPGERQQAQPTPP